MKKVMTWEINNMIAQKTKDGTVGKLQDKKYRLLKGFLGQKVKEGEICYVTQFCNFYGLANAGLRCDFNGFEEWEEIQQPVTFMEAVKAYAEGKTIWSEIAGDKMDDYKPESISLYSGLKTSDGLGVSPIEILQGTWYIEEAE